MASAHPLSIPPAPWNSTVNLRKREDLSRHSEKVGFDISTKKNGLKLVPFGGDIMLNPFGYLILT